MIKATDIAQAGYAIWVNFPESNHEIQVIESPMLSRPWPDENGELKYHMLYDKETKKCLVPNLYSFVIQLLDITEGVKMACRLATQRINERIDNQ